MPIIMATLPKEKIPNATIFQAMNNKTSNELSENYFYSYQNNY